MRCRVCGNDNPSADNGRPRRYCTDACRQRAHRLRRAGQEQWPWWAEQRRKDRERRAEEQRQADARRAALDLLPPDVAERIRQAESDKYLAAMQAGIRRAERWRERIDKAEHLAGQELMAALAGRPARYGDPCDDLQLMPLINKAVIAESDEEGRAYFEKVRALWRGLS